MARRSNVSRPRRRSETLQWRPTWGSKELAARKKEAEVWEEILKDRQPPEDQTKYGIPKENRKKLHADWTSTLEQLPKADKTRSFETTRPKDRVLKNEGTKVHHSLSVTQGRPKDSPSEIQYIALPVQIVQLSLKKP